MDYRCFIPMNLPEVLAQWKPDAKVMAIHGNGEIKVHTYPTERTKFLTIFPQLQARAKIGYNSQELVTELPTLKDIITDMRGHQVFRGTIDFIKLYVDVDKKWSKNEYVALSFGKYTPHRNLDLMRMGNGGKIYAELQLYTYLESITEKLPMELCKRYKKTIMVLEKTQPREDLIKDFNFITEITDSDLYMKNFIFNKKDFLTRYVDAIQPPKKFTGEMNG